MKFPQTGKSCSQYVKWIDYRKNKISVNRQGGDDKMYPSIEESEKKKTQILVSANTTDVNLYQEAILKQYSVVLKGANSGTKFQLWSL